MSDHSAQTPREGEKSPSVPDYPQKKTNQEGATSKSVAGGQGSKDRLLLQVKGGEDQELLTVIEEENQ